MQTTHLQPNYPSHIKDKKHFLNLIEKPPPLPPNAVLVTADVTSLYTNIPHEEGIAAMIHFMEICRHLLPTNCPPPHIVRIILDFILKHSTFKFMDTHKHQILGISRGTRMPPPPLLCHHNPNFPPPNILLETFHWWYFLHFSWLPLQTQILDDIHEYNQPHY